MSDLIVSPVKVIDYGEYEKAIFADNPRWQPISTAPRDGSNFLAYVPYCIGWCDICGVGPIRICYWSDDSGQFVGSDRATIGDKITHWCPFPTPPNDAQLALLDGVTLEALPEFDDEEDDFI